MSGHLTPAWRAFPDPGSDACNSLGLDPGSRMTYIDKDEDVHIVPLSLLLLPTLKGERPGVACAKSGILRIAKARRIVPAGFFCRPLV